MSYDPTILQARAVHQARQRRICDSCERPLVGPHLYFYVAGPTPRPSAYRLHRGCIREATERDLKVAAALIAWRRLVPPEEGP